MSNEILLQMIEETRPDGIVSFVRCCRRIWVLGAQALKQHQQDLDRYQAPDLWFRNDKPECDFSSYEYLFQILLKPRRALYVNDLFVLNLGLRLCQIRAASFTANKLIMIDDLCDLFFNTVGCPYIQDGEVGKWVERLRRGDTNAVVCLLLTLLPNLKTLSITDYSNQGYAEVICEVSKAYQSPCRMIPGPLPLNKLDTIIINDTGSMNWPREGLGIYETCMTLPSLRRIKGKCIDCSFNRWPKGDEFPQESKVTEIDFDHSAINFQAFTRLFTRTKGLQRLTYGLSRLVGIFGDHTAMSLKKILEQYIAHTLTHLDLRIDEFPFNNSRRYIGSLRQLHMLKHLRIHGNMFIDYSSGHGDSHWVVDLLPLLPASIETLTLLPQANDRTVTYTLDELREKKKDCLPNLKKITCDSFYTIADGLIDECASVGIDWVQS